MKCSRQNESKSTRRNEEEVIDRMNKELCAQKIQIAKWTVLGGNSRAMVDRRPLLPFTEDGSNLKWKSEYYLFGPELVARGSWLMLLRMRG